MTKLYIKKKKKELNAIGVGNTLILQPKKQQMQTHSKDDNDNIRMLIESDFLGRIVIGLVNLCLPSVQDKFPNKGNP